VVQGVGANGRRMLPGLGGKGQPAWTGLYSLSNHCSGRPKMRRALLLVAVFGAGIILGACSGVLLKPRHECPGVQTAFKLNDPGYAAFIANRIKTLEWPNTDGTVTRFGVGDESAPTRNLTIKGKEPLSIPDDHGHTTLALVEIRENKAEIAYMSEFHHLSFGKNLVTVDCGIVELDVLKKGH